ncbi:MAG: DNA circularization N-terminal domain-containing protein [Bdellovibrionota bacterium]
MKDEWQNLTNGSFRGIPFHVAIPSRDHQYGVESEEMTLERRLQFIKRPLIDGAPVRDWGQDPETFVAVIEFFGVNHAKTAETFLQALNQGAPGTLILPTAPKAVLAFFWKRSRATSYREGNAIRVTVTWVAAAEVESAGNGISTAQDVAAPSIDEAKSALDTDVSNAQSILQNNPFIKAVRGFESILSTAKSAVNAVLTLDQGVRSKIVSLQADIASTLALIKAGTDEIQAVFSPNKPSASSGGSLGTNTETGETIIDFSEPDVIPAPADPLAPPPVQSTVSISTNNLGSNSGVAIFGSNVAASLSANQSALDVNSSGRTEDVSRSLTAVLNSLAAYISAIGGVAPIEFELLTDMSLGEVLFVNSIDLAELRAVQKVNPQVTDPFFIPKGTVVLI